MARQKTIANQLLFSILCVSITGLILLSTIVSLSIRKSVSTSAKETAKEMAFHYSQKSERCNESKCYPNQKHC